MSKSAEKQESLDFLKELRVIAKRSLAVSRTARDVATVAMSESASVLAELNVQIELLEESLAVITPIRDKYNETEGDALFKQQQEEAHYGV